MKRNQWAAAVLAILLFCGGAAIGALADHFYTIRTVSAKNAEYLRQRYINETRMRCKLTPDQVTQLEAILDDTKAKVKAVRDAYHPQMVKIHDEQVARVKSILRPDQIPAYEQLVAERQRRGPR
jgi:uncharacterized protein YnzC (UPF0291/DUF896 family)